MPESSRNPNLVFTTNSMRNNTTASVTRQTSASKTFTPAILMPFALESSM